MTIVVNRPEIIWLSRAIFKLDELYEHTLVHTSQNYGYELNEVIFSDLGIRKADVFLEAADASDTETIGQLIISTDQTMQQAPRSCVVATRWY